MVTKKQFLNKINKRIRTMVKEFGISTTDITDRISMDGVYTTDAGYLGIDKDFWTPELAEALEKLVPTMQQEKAEAIDRINKSISADFIGPIPKTPSKQAIAHEAQAKFSVESAWEEIREKYYEIEDLLAALDSNLIDKIANFGTDFYNEDASYSDLLEFRDTILKELEDAI